MELGCPALNFVFTGDDESKIANTPTRACRVQTAERVILPAKAIQSF